MDGPWQQRILQIRKIREQDPLKQGLKPVGTLLAKAGLDIDLIREQDPIKQGLKLAPSLSRWTVEMIREQDPLKQGLKLFASSSTFWGFSKIREQDPLKQGLKLNFNPVIEAEDLFVSKIQ